MRYTNSVATNSVSSQWAQFVEITLIQRFCQQLNNGGLNVEKWKLTSTLFVNIESMLWNIVESILHFGWNYVEKLFELK